MTTDLEGVRGRHWHGPPALKRLMAKSLARRSLVTYEVVAPPAEEPAAEAPPKEKRTSARRRLRLRSAKLLDVKNGFICECLVRDESAHGLCLKLMRNIGLPSRCHLYDDDSGAIHVVATMWRRGTLLGVRYCTGATPVAMKPSDRSALRGRYYAVAD